MAQIMRLLKYIFFLLPFWSFAQSGTIHTGKVNINNGNTVPTERLYVNGSSRFLGQIQIPLTSGVLTVNGSGVLGVQPISGLLPTPGANGTVLTSNGTTASWNLLNNNNIANGAGIFVSKLASGADNTVIKTLPGGGGIGWGLITNDNIDGSAAIVPNKLSLTNTYIMYGNISNLGSGTSNFTFSNATNALTVGTIRLFRSTGTTTNNIGIGTGVLGANANGIENIGLGDGALAATTDGISNVGIGTNALNANTLGVYNVALGNYSMASNTTGTNNTAIGFNTLSQSGLGSNNIALGTDAGRLGPAGQSNNVFIGHTGNLVSGSNNIVIGDNNNARIMVNSSGVVRLPVYTTNAIITTTGGNGTLTAATTIPASTISGTNTQIAYWSGGVLTGDNNFWRSGTSMGLGIAATTGYNFISRVAFNTANANSVGIGSEGRLEAGATNVRYFATDVTAQGAASPTGVYHFSARQNSISSAIIANQYGFHVDNNLSGAGNNFGFHSNIGVNSTANWNLYMAGTAPNYMAGGLGIGTTSVTGYNVRATNNITGGTSNTSHGVSSEGQIQSDVTTLSSYYRTTANTQAASFNLTTLNHFSSTQGTFGAGSTVTNQMGFAANSSLIGATNNYGFYGNIASGTGRWNLFMNGTANNYVGGRMGFGTTTLTTNSISNTLTIGGGASANAFNSSGIVQNDVTTQANYFSTSVNTLAASFNLSALVHYSAQQGTFGAGSSVTNQYGFLVGSTLSGATNNYGFFGNMPAASGVWNFHAAGTAQNYMAGNLGIGSGKTVPTYAVDVNGVVAANRFQNQGSAPSIAAGAGAGTSPTIAIVGRDNDFKITLTTGTTPTGTNAIVATVTYAGGAYPNGSVPTCTAGIAGGVSNTALLSGTSMFATDGTTTTMVLYSGTVALTPATQYVFNCHSGGY